MDRLTIRDMAKDEKEGKDEKEDEKHGKEEKGKTGKDPLGGFLGGFILILLGVVYIARGYLPDPDTWFAWFIAGIGVLFFIKAGLHSVKPEWKKPVTGELIAGVMLLFVGGASVLGFEEWWPLVIVAAGVILIIKFARGFHG